MFTCAFDPMLEPDAGRLRRSRTDSDPDHGPQEAAPGDGYVWVAGRHEWRSALGRFFWIPGHWTRDAS